MLVSACISITPKPASTPTASQVAFLIPTITATNTRVPTTAVIATATQPAIATVHIGNSVAGRLLQATRIGRGERTLVLVAALHGDEANTQALLNELSSHYQGQFPSDDFSLYVIPILNPDGRMLNERLNANGVDLNRNWDTANWQADTQGPHGRVIGGGGKAPFSEPETTAFAAFLQDLQAASPYSVTVIFYHAFFMPDGSLLPSFTLADGAISPEPTAVSLGQAYAITINAYYANKWEAYDVTGEALNWCGENDFICLEIELPSRADLSPNAIESHIAALDALMATLAASE